ncbi:MAG: ectoine synthase [Alphaproteobacteria bacterium]|jgi:L-ectoine synthase
MIVKTEQDIEGGKGETVLSGGDARVLRYLLREDGVGFTVSDIRVKAGSSAVLHYKNHIESNLVIEGEGTVEDMATGEVHNLAPGTVYVLDKHDKHRVNATTAMRLICVFTPALVGGETHDEDGAYPLL